MTLLDGFFQRSPDFFAGNIQLSSENFPELENARCRFKHASRWFLASFGLVCAASLFGMIVASIGAAAFLVGMLSWVFRLEAYRNLYADTLQASGIFRKEALERFRNEFRYVDL